MLRQTMQAELDSLGKTYRDDALVTAAQDGVHPWLGSPGKLHLGLVACGTLALASCKQRPRFFQPHPCQLWRPVQPQACKVRILMTF